MSSIIIVKDSTDTLKTFRKNETRVLLMAKYYRVSRRNPCIGSGLECEGTIAKVHPDLSGKVSSDTYCLNVAWDNGTCNSYRPLELLVVDLPIKFKSTNPNLVFKNLKEEV